MDPRASPLFDQCLKEALSQSRDWIVRWLGALHEVLLQREQSAAHHGEKQAFLQARLSLERHRDMIAGRFLEQLGLAVGSALPVDAGPPARSGAPRSLQSLSLDDLELMDDRQVQETVELARVQQVVKMAADEELAGLSARLSRLQGLSVVRHEANPLRPDVVVSALMRALATLHVEEAVRSRWLHAGALALGEALQGFYQRLCVLLDGWGVEPAGYAVVQAPQPRASAPVAGPGNIGVRSESLPATALVGQDALLTLDHLHHLLVGNLDQAGGAVSDQGHSGSGNAMVRTLAAEVVTLLLRRIAEDARLLPPVRDMLDGLKQPLQQLARTDPRFFADRQNPARRLLDGITERSLAFTSEQDPGFGPFAEVVREVVHELQMPGPNLAERFTQQLIRLAQTVSPATTPARGLAVQTLVRAEQRNLLAQRVAEEIQARNDFARAPGVVRRFLIGPWAQVVAQARLGATEAATDRPGEAPALRYMDVLPDLLWSSQLALASRNRPRLIKVIPLVLRTLREGLDSIDYPRAQSEAFFQALMGLHEAAYKTHHSEGVPAPEPPVGRQAVLDSGAWLHPSEARDSGFMEDMQIETQPSYLDTQPMQRDWADLKAEQARQQGQLLPVGTWVDLREDEHTVRCQLTWASPHGTMFLFNSADGRSISLTRRGLDRLQELGRIHVVAERGMVDEALNAVAQQALLNSGKH